ncbi:hypothetical protein FF125_11140 [Aureibaculum algae]|uniref:Signal transduction histidine kinase internal region domain-containing protein n=1 Tax=Aureibaculum algae TaxID=2584122 RepID=A0A5B7TUN6_9FLAO|nr:histidine kinase [Aureibaculum algae]QCX38963.1 hypothetical protein FF125_11140 [Aureibaculum algae]
MIKNIFLLVLVSASFLMQAQEPVSVHLSEKDGLPDKEFYSILEDENGFIWLGADKGLYRYDGKTFKNYNSEKQLGLSVFNIQQAPSGLIWCNNISGQFFYVENNKLNLFIDLGKQLNGQLADFIIKNEYLYILTLKKIYKVNLKTKSIEYNQPLTQRYGSIFKIDDRIYYENLNSIVPIVTEKKNKVTNLMSSRKESDTINNYNKNTKIFKVSANLVFRKDNFNSNRFYSINKSKNTLNLIHQFQVLSKERIYNTFENNKEIWFATSTGVWVFELKRNHFFLIKRFLKDRNVTNILKDKDDNYWFTTLNNGIYVIPNITIETCIITEPNKNISSLDIVNDSTLVFGNTNGNIGFYNTNTYVEKIIKLPSKDRVSKLKYLSNSNTVFISKDLSAYSLHINSLKLTKIEGARTAKSLTLLNNDNLLFTSYNSAIVLEKSNFKNEKKYISGEKRTYASFYNKINQTAYIAFVDNLVSYDNNWNSKKILFNNQPIYGKSITETANGTLWIATFKNGVLGIKNDTVIQHYTTKNGLTSNNVLMVKADQNKLWIALGNSIQVLDVDSKQLKTLTKSDGILSYDVSGIEIVREKVYFSSSQGLFSIHKDQSFKTQNADVYFNKVEINEKDTIITSKYSLKYHQNAINIGFNVNGFLYNQKRKYKYRLKGFNNAWLITDIGVNSVKYNSLPTGKYTFQVQPILDNTLGNNKIKSLIFTIRKPFWKTWWFLVALSILILGSTILYYRKKIKIKEHERVTQLEKISLEKELINLNLTALRSQMNPHFIFNSLNSIQDLVLKEDTNASYDYIVLFSKLIRNTLTYSNQDFIPLEKELDFLNIYLQLEKLRFGESFSYNIHFEGNENLEVPSLLIQPFIENALVHGLLHKVGEKKLSVIFNFTNSILQCTITDNGIGRKKAEEIANRQGNLHESFALQAIEKRLEIFKKQFNQNIGFTIKDSYTNETVKGTTVVLTMPFKKQF